MAIALRVPFDGLSQPLSHHIYVPPSDDEVSMPKPKRGQAARVERIIERHFANVRPSQLPALREQLAKSLVIADRYHECPCGLTPCPLVKIHCACDDRMEANEKPRELLTPSEEELLAKRCACCHSRPFRPCSCFARYGDCEHITALWDELLNSFDREKWPWTREQFAAFAEKFLPGYAEPPLPSVPTKRVTKEQELDVFIVRAGKLSAGSTSARALRHPDDVCEKDTDATGTQAGKGLVRLRPRLTRR